MKKRKKLSSELLFSIALVILVLMVIGIVIFNLLYQTLEDWKKVGADLIDSLLSAITVSLALAVFTKIISDNLIKIKKNDRKLKSFGIREIGDGLSTDQDKIDLFGDPEKNIYPTEVKLFFITGNGFLKHYEAQIENYLRQPNTVLKILLVNYRDSNSAYLARMEAICPQTPCYRDQILTQSLPTLRGILQRTGADPSRVQLRFFKDEYRYNYRIANYSFGSIRQTECWWNVQPFNKDAVELSIMLRGSYVSDKNGDGNVVYYLDKGFDEIFEKYQSTQFKFE